MTTADCPNDADDRAMLDLAARLGFRGWGHVEPNPMVGCVIAGPARGRGGPARERIIGMGHHRRFGGLHAEAEALANCRARGHDPAGATVYVTLEPCNAPGKQPACVEALIGARVARVVAARRDPNTAGGKAGGAERLRAAGIACEFSEASAAATRLSEPFLRRLATGLPWVIVKWAQTIDGKIATRAGESQWISSDRSRRWVHLTRARVDAILTGIGTVKADDPLLTARGVPVRRVAIKAIIDPAGELPRGARVVTHPGPARVVVFVAADPKTDDVQVEEAGVSGEGREVSVVAVGGTQRRVDLREVLAHLAREGASTVLCECGPGMTSELWRQRLVDELHVYVAPRLMGDQEARPPLRGFEFPALADVPRLDLVHSKRIGEDMLLVYRRPAD